jgi:hypothetical protein
MQRSEGHELKDRIGETEKDESERDAFKTQDAAQTVPQSQPNRVKKQDNEISAAQSKQRVDPRDGIQHRRAPPWRPEKWSSGVVE